MTAHKFILEPYRGMRTRFVCPSCRSNDKTFTRYIDTDSREYLNESVGRCSRENQCACHYTPKQYFSDNMGINHVINATNNGIKKKGYNGTLPPSSYDVAKHDTIPSYISTDVFKASLKSHDNNNFVKYLIQLLGVDLTSLAISKYFIGTSKHWDGATVFWQIDQKGNVRAGKIFLYDSTTGKRVKKPFSHLTWVHSVTKQDDFNLSQCLFGTHLLNVKENHIKPIGIFESEKTAIIASAYLPQFVCLATGGLNNLKPEKCEVLKGRKVVLFPDLGAESKWIEKANELSKFCSVTVSKLLETGASEEERKGAYDLADYLVKFKPSEFLESIKRSEFEFSVSIKKEDFPQVNTGIQEGFSAVKNETCLPVLKVGKTDLNHSIASSGELREFFNNSTLPTTPLTFGIGIISDLPLFIDSHLCIIEANKGSPICTPYLNRLIQLKQLLSQSKYL